MYPGSDPDTEFLLDAPTMDPQGWRYSTESLAQSISMLQEDTRSIGEAGPPSGNTATLLEDPEGVLSAHLQPPAIGPPATSFRPQTKPATTILPNAFEKWTQSLSASCACQGAEAGAAGRRKRGKSVRFNLEAEARKAEGLDAAAGCGSAGGPGGAGGAGGVGGGGGAGGGGGSDGGAQQGGNKWFAKDSLATSIKQLLRMSPSSGKGEEAKLR